MNAGPTGLDSAAENLPRAAIPAINGIGPLSAGDQFIVIDGKRTYTTVDLTAHGLPLCAIPAAHIMRHARTPRGEDTAGDHVTLMSDQGIDICISSLIQNSRAKRLPVGIIPYSSIVRRCIIDHCE